MPQSHTHAGRGLDRRLLLIAATMAAGSALASGFQMLSAWADEPPANDKNSKQDALVAAQREPSATGYPRPFNY
jgi:hypothetical protein